MTADVFVTAVRTGGPGAKGISMLVVERCDELQTNLIKTTYSTAAGTSLVLYEDVKVPVENRTVIALFSHCNRTVIALLTPPLLRFQWRTSWGRKAKASS
jgi:alkylation response protein AidB-like acyl-CoA dehydrogenase